MAKRITQPAPEPEVTENLFGTASDDDMRAVLAETRNSLGDLSKYLTFLQGQVLFYTHATAVSEDPVKAARKAGFFNEVYAEALTEL